MTVRELIKQLVEMPLDAQVVRFMGGTDSLNNLPVTEVIYDRSYDTKGRDAKIINAVILT